MSASICWRKVDPNPETLPVLAPSAFMEALDRAGMELPHAFDTDDIPVLRGLAAGSNLDGFKELIELIERHGMIKVWPQY